MRSSKRVPFTRFNCAHKIYRISQQSMFYLAENYCSTASIRLDSIFFLRLCHLSFGISVGGDKKRKEKIPTGTKSQVTITKTSTNINKLIAVIFALVEQRKIESERVRYRVYSWYGVGMSVGAGTQSDIRKMPRIRFYCFY